MDLDFWCHSQQGSTFLVSRVKLSCHRESLLEFPRHQAGFDLLSGQVVPKLLQTAVAWGAMNVHWLLFCNSWGHMYSFSEMRFLWKLSVITWLAPTKCFLSSETVKSGYSCMKTKLRTANFKDSTKRSSRISRWSALGIKQVKLHTKMSCDRVFDHSFWKAVNILFPVLKNG